MDIDRSSEEYRTKRAEQLERLSAAMTVLYYSHPLYYAIASQLGLLDATGEIDTMGVGFLKDDPTCYFFYNVDFMASISDEKLRFAAMHEYLHVGLLHPTRGIGMNAEVANLAMDIIVNESHISEYEKLKAEEKDLIVLKENPLKWQRQPDGTHLMMPNPDAGKSMFPCLDGLVIRDTSMEEIYLLLMKNPEQVEKFMQKAGKGSGDGEFKPSSHDKFTPQRDKSKKPGKTIRAKDLTEEQKSTLEKMNSEAFQRLGGKDPGNVPGELRRKFEDFKKKPAYPWRRELTMFSQTVLKDEQERSWRRYNRRYGAASPGHVKQYRAKLLVIVDNSGSTYGAYDAFMGHVLTLSELMEEVRVIGIDTRINFEATVKGGKIPEIAFGNSGGGTDMQPGFDYAKQHGFDGVICLTDGFLGIPDAHRVPTLFAICKGGTDVPGFRNIPLEDGE